MYLLISLQSIVSQQSNRCDIFFFLDKKSRTEEVHDLNFDAYRHTFPAMLWLALPTLAFM